MKVTDTIEELMKCPELYNSVSNYLKQNFDVQSAELSLLCTYVVKHYCEFILSEGDVMRDENIIYIHEILKLFNREDRYE